MDSERDRRPPAHGVQDREEHPGPRAAGKLAHHEYRVVVPVEAEEAPALAPASRGKRVQVAPQAVGPDGAALVEATHALPSGVGEQAGQARVEEPSQVERVGAAVHRRPPAERMDHLQHAKLRVEAGCGLAEEGVARGDRADIRGGQALATPSDVDMDPLSPEASLGKPLLVECAPYGAGPPAPRRSRPLPARIALERGLEVVLHGPMYLERNLRPQGCKQVRVLPAQVEYRAVVRAAQVGHLDAGSPRKARARVERRPPPEDVALKPPNGKRSGHWRPFTGPARRTRIRAWNAAGRPRARARTRP